MSPRSSVWGCLQVLLIVANVGTAVVLFPIIKRQSETGAIGYVSARIIEAVFIAIGLVSILAILFLREECPTSRTPPSASSSWRI